MIIVISGDPGSGKSTLREKLKQTTGFPDFYAGGFWRSRIPKGEDIDIFYKKLASNPHAERELDAYQAEIMRKEKNLIIEGRVTPFLAPEIPKIKIFLRVSPEEGAKRLSNRKEYNGLPLEEIQKRTAERIDTERARYEKLYGISDHLNTAWFDIVINTTSKNQNEVFESTWLVLEHYPYQI
ncbi:AAA family ATPase [Candidatus Jorgensenbacteria bacterium]|nr:AAA family ATPase [Candidatus Jorgensenbacteria bacterium]